LLCTGCRNKDLSRSFPLVFKSQPKLKIIDIYDAMNPEKVYLLFWLGLNKTVHLFNKDDTVSIFGASHSGFLALMNLY
jgi:hypothetical protein